MCGALVPVLLALAARYGRAVSRARAGGGSPDHLALGATLWTRTGEATAWHLKPTKRSWSWRVDETYIRVQGRWCYLYRDIDSSGATIDFLLSALRDKARLCDAAIAAMKGEGSLRQRCRHRPVQYLNNLLEQDHRAIKRRVQAKQSFREFDVARRTLAGLFSGDDQQSHLEELKMSFEPGQFAEQIPIQPAARVIFTDGARRVRRLA